MKPHLCRESPSYEPSNHPVHPRLFYTTALKGRFKSDAKRVTTVKMRSAGPLTGDIFDVLQLRMAYVLTKNKNLGHLVVFVATKTGIINHNMIFYSN